MVPTTDLTGISPLVNAAYATFATNVRTNEATLASATTGMPGSVTSTSVGTQVVSAILTLKQTLAADLTALPTASALILDQLDATGLGIRMADLFDAAGSQSPDGSVSPDGLALLETAVDAQIAASYQQTSVDLYLASIATPAGATGTATIAILTPPTGATVAEQVEIGINALEETLASDLTLVPTASALIFQQLDASGLGIQMADLFAAATSLNADGSVPATDLPILYTAVDAQMAASLQQTEGDLFLDADSQAKGTSIDLTTIGTEVNTAYATFATLVRDAELTLTTSTTMGGGPTGPVSTGITVAGGDAVVGTSGSRTLEFTVSLSAASTTAVTVDYATADGTAIAGTDYTATSGTLTFAPGVTSRTVQVTILGETTTDTDKTLTLNHTDAGGATITSDSATGEILYATGTPAISVADASTNVGTSGTSTLTFTVSLSAVSANTVTIDYATADGTAIAGTDYTAASGTLTFAPGTTSQTVAVTATGESSTVAGKTLTLNLTGATETSNATASATGTLNYTIVGSQNDLSDNLANAPAGVETATGTTQVAANFTTGTSSFTLNELILLLDQSTAGAATLAIYSDGGLQPGTLLGTLTSPTSFSTTLTDTTFTTSGITLAANTTYWVVLGAASGAYDWSWTADDSGTGTGFTDTWAESDDSGTTWFAYNSSPTQFSVLATATS